MSKGIIRQYRENNSKDGRKIYPNTVTKAVYRIDGTPLDDELDKISKKQDRPVNAGTQGQVLSLKNPSTGETEWVDAPSTEEIETEVEGKVDKVDGKGLSTNDYTTSEKQKLAGIEAGAEKNVLPDWNATSGKAIIRNKPAIPTKTSQLTNDSGFISQHQTLKTINGTSLVGSGDITIDPESSFEVQVDAEGSSYTSDKTIEEIRQAVLDGKYVYASIDSGVEDERIMLPLAVHHPGLLAGFAKVVDTSAITVVINGSSVTMAMKEFATASQVQTYVANLTSLINQKVNGYQTDKVVEDVDLTLAQLLEIKRKAESAYPVKNEGTMSLSEINVMMDSQRSEGVFHYSTSAGVKYTLVVFGSGNDVFQLRSDSSSADIQKRKLVSGEWQAWTSIGNGGGGDDANCVHKTGDETISGKKSFAYIKARTIDMESVDSSDEWAQFNLNDDGGGEGYISVDSSLRNVRLNGLADPTENNDAATKSYVDGKDASVAHKAGSETFTGRKSFIAGASFSDVQVGEDGLKILTADIDEIHVTPSWDDDNGINILNLEGDAGDVLVKGVHAPSANTDAANKAYVDNHHDSTAVHKTGDETISGEKIFTGCFGIGDHIYYDGERLDFDGVNPTGLQNPVDDMDAVNKEYVDTGLNGKANDSQVVKIVAQTLTSADQLQARTNIDVYSKAEVNSLIVTTINANY